jgi:cystathionine gamma-lyase
MERLNLLQNQLVPNKVSKEINWGKYNDSANNHEKYKEVIEKYMSEVKIQPHPGFSTKAIHIGSEPDPIHGQVVVPIGLSTTYAQKSPGVMYSKFDYARVSNPTREAFERCLASLEYANYCIASSSGCATMTTILLQLTSGDHVIACDDVYGGTQRYFRRIANEKHKIEFDFVDLTDLDAVRKAIKKNTKLLWLESPTNPTLKICDIKKLTQIAREHGILTVVDSTFATPVLQSPLLLGADIVVHSCTKFIGGHTDVLMGAMCLNDKELYERLQFTAKTFGPSPSPFECYNALRSLKTLKIRVEAAVKNAYVVANFLDNHPKIEKVLYPGLKSHPQHEVGKDQMRGPGAMITIYVKGGLAGAKTFLENVKIFTLAESLGGVESLIESPAIMTHASVPVEVRKKLGIEDNLVRLSVGIEDIGNMLADLDHSLSLI